MQSPADNVQRLPTPGAAPIGVFDSGVGGLSVLRALQAQLPDERFVYVADSGHAPYGDRDDAHVLQRSHAIAQFLSQTHHIKLLVVACNTATAAAIHALRQADPDLPIVGIEPAVKPAMASTVTGRVAVLATRATLNSEKFHHLQRSLHGDAHLILQPCDGLAAAIERDDVAAIARLCQTYLEPLGPFGLHAGAIDSLVLGCTHYPFVTDTLRAITGDAVRLFECGEPVARQTQRLLEKTHRLAAGSQRPSGAPANMLFYTSGQPEALEAAVARWLGTTVCAQPLTA